MWVGYFKIKIFAKIRANMDVFDIIKRTKTTCGPNLWVSAL